MPSADSPLHAAIRRARRPLADPELDGGHYRRWAAAVCAAEAKHAAMASAATKRPSASRTRPTPSPP